MPATARRRRTRRGLLPVILGRQACDHRAEPDDARVADGTLRLQVQFLFPKSRPHKR